MDEQIKRKRGAQPGNVNAMTHGFYSRRFQALEHADLTAIPERDLTSEVALLRVLLRRLFEVLDQATDTSLDTQASVLAIAGGTAVRIATLLRNQAILGGEAEDINTALSAALIDTLKDIQCRPPAPNQPPQT